MNTHTQLSRLILCLGLLPALLAGCVQPETLRLSDPFRLTEPKNFTAHRASSNNPDWNSNDDSKRPIPGETTVLADLQGPGAVTHIWMTIADNEFGWPRLLRLRVYYDGSDTPSVDAPVGDFFAVGNGVEREVDSLMVRDSSDGRARNCYWPMPFRKSCKITVTNEGRRRVTMLYYHVDWSKLPSLPAAVPSKPRVEPIGDERGHFSLSSHSFKAKAWGQAENAWSKIRMCTGIGLEVFGANGLRIAKTHLADGRQVGG